MVAYRQADYRAWLEEAGFKTIDIVPPTPATLAFARQSGPQNGSIGTVRSRPCRYLSGAAGL